MKTRKIFIGGWENTGTRLIVQLLILAGYNSLDGHCNDQFDYKHKEMSKIVYDILINNDDPQYLIQMIEKDVFKTLPMYECKCDPKLLSLTYYQKIRKKYEYFVIKNGYLMLFIPLLKEAFPDSIFILCVRHPLDTLIKPSFNYVLFGKNETVNPPIMQKFKLYKEWYDKAIPYADYIVKLEDLLFNKENTISKLYNFLGIDTEINDEILNVIGQPSNNVGKSSIILDYIKELGY